MAEKPLSPLEQHLAGLKDKLSKVQGLDVMAFDDGSGRRANAEARKQESVARAELFIRNCEDAIRAEQPPVEPVQGIPAGILQ